MDNETLTTGQAAERLGVSVGRVRQMIQAGRLPATKFGNANVIRAADLKPLQDRKPGRPPKAKPENGSKRATKKGGKR